MAANADSVVVELLAKVDQFDQPVKQSAAQFSANMDKIAASATKAESAVSKSSSSSAAAIKRDYAQAGQAMQLFGSQTVNVGDLLAGPTSPFVVPVKQGPAVVKAIGGVAASAVGLGTVIETLSGVGIALLIASFIGMITKSDQASDSLDELVKKLRDHHDQTVLNDQAQRIYDRTVEGSIDAMHKLTAEIDKQNLTLQDNIALKKAAIAGTLNDVLGNIGSVSADLAQAVLQYREAQRIVQDIQSGKLAVGENPTAALISAQTGLEGARQKVADLTAQLAGLSTAADTGARALRSVDFPLIEQRAKNAVNPIGAINDKYDQMASNAKRAGTYTQQLADQIERLRTAELKAAQTRSASGTGDFGRQVSFGDAESIAKAAGLTVTSGYRSTADQARLFNDPAYNHPGNPVARPGTSAHEGVNGKWALDIAFAPGLTAQSLKKLYGDEGVSLSAVYKESGHFHIEGQRTQGEVSADRDRLRAAEELARVEQRNSERASKDLFTESEVTVAKGQQRDLVQELLTGHETLAEIIRNDIEPSLKDWNKEYQQIIEGQQELNRFGSQMIDEVLNPDNWTSFGDIGKRVLHELEVEFIQLAAINPLKNLLLGQNNPTLGSILGSLFGGVSGSKSSGLNLSSGLNFSNSFGAISGVPHFAGGGAFPVSGSAGDTNMLSINGINRALVGGNETIAVIPSNAKAVAPGGGQQPGFVLVHVEASPYFDGRVLQVSGPVIARAAVSSANGGATIARRNLAREAQNRLE